jgi:hypothetical protein
MPCAGARVTVALSGSPSSSRHETRTSAGAPAVVRAAAVTQPSPVMKRCWSGAAIAIFVSEAAPCAVATTVNGSGSPELPAGV